MPRSRSGGATIEDVAALAGVSRAAVSKVIRNAYGVSPAMRERVGEAIQQLSYRPRVAARAMRGSTYTIGFEVGSEPGAADFLTACATDSSHVFLAADSNALKAAFKTIAKSITKLRISK